MALKHYKPTTPGQRQLVLVDRSALYKGEPVKALTTGKISSGGRNNNGRITVRFRGGGHKRALRLVDFKRGRHDLPARVERIETPPLEAEHAVQNRPPVKGFRDIGVSHERTTSGSASNACGFPR